MAHAEHEPDCLMLPREAVRFPLSWRPSAGFRVDDPASWPLMDGRFEYVAGRIQYMPPCGEQQQDTASDVTGALHVWVRSHPDYVLGSNEAGMLLDGEVRGADAAVWRATHAGRTKGLRRHAPVLAVEIAGEDEDEDVLRDKAAWYLRHGVSVVWLVMPERREVVVLRQDGESVHARGERLPEDPALPGLTPEVSDLFLQLDRAG